MMREHTLIPSSGNRFSFVELTLGEDANIHKVVACKYLSNDICTGVEEWKPWLLLPRILLFFDTLRPRVMEGSEGVAALWSGFWARSWVSWRKLHWSPLRTMAYFFPLVTDTLSSFNATHSLSILDHCSCFNSPVSGVKVSQSEFLIKTPLHHCLQFVVNWASISSDESPCRTFPMQF